MFPVNRCWLSRIKSQNDSSVVLVGGFDGMNGPPGGASRIPNGQDTDLSTDWTRNDYEADLDAPVVDVGSAEFLALDVGVVQIAQKILEPLAAVHDGARVEVVGADEVAQAAADASAGDSFGFSVAVSGDTVVVGAHKKAEMGATSAGAAYVFPTSFFFSVRLRKRL